MFSIAQFIEELENQGATRGTVEGGKVTRVFVKGAWQTVATPLAREAIESALLECLSPAHKRELEKTEGRFWFRHERTDGAWMVCVQWKSALLHPVRRVAFVFQAAAMSDPIEAAEIDDFTSTNKAPQLKSAAQEALLRADKSSAAPRNVGQMQEAARQIPKAPPPLSPQTPPQQPAPWESGATGSAPPPLPAAADYSVPTAPRAPTARWEEVSPDTYRWWFGTFAIVVLVLSMFSVRGYNNLRDRDFSSMLSESVDRKEDSLRDVSLRKVDVDSYEGSGTFRDGSRATINVEIKTWKWNNVPSTFRYGLSYQFNFEFNLR